MAERERLEEMFTELYAEAEILEEELAGDHFTYLSTFSRLVKTHLPETKLRERVEFTLKYKELYNTGRDEENFYAARDELTSETIGIILVR